MKYTQGKKSGMSVVEVMIAAAVFVIFATPAVFVVISGLNMNRLSVEQMAATQFAGEGIEAVKSIKNQAYNNLLTPNPTPRGVTRNGSNVWEFLGNNTNNTLSHNSGGSYIRTIKIENVNRDAAPPDGNIVASGGTADLDTKKVSSTVTWNFNTVRPESVTLVSYLSDWRKPLASQRGGILVYGNGGLTTDSMQYKILDTSGNWSSENSMADIDGATTNRRLRAIRLYSSPSRNEKIAISRHHNGTTQYIYAQVFNGVSWGNVVLLASWNANTFLDVRNFDGAYLENGHFMAVYSNNTTTPQYRTWNGTTWSGQNATRNVGGIPSYIVARRRPGTNEAMVAVFDQVSDTNTEYFNLGANGTYELADWTLLTQHAASAPNNSRELVDFAWSPNTTTKGALVYSNSGTDTRMNIRIFTANGTGGGSWSGTAEAPVQGRLVTVSVEGRKGADEFIACAGDVGEDIRCFESSFVPAWTTPTNYIIEPLTDTGNQRSYQMAYESTSGDTAIIVYSDQSAVPKLKRFNPATNTWETDAQETDLGTMAGPLETVRMVPQTDSDDIMVLMGGGSQNMYTDIWDGGANSMYTSPAGKGFIHQASNGSSDTDMWYDFEWDKH